jgi:thiamine pyrophosphokinase
LDSAMERVMKLDIKVDVLLGDFDGDFDPNYYKTISTRNCSYSRSKQNRS